MELKDRIIKYILTNGPVSMDNIINVAKGRGFAEGEVLIALDKVHRDKRIQQMADVTGHVMYKPATAKTTEAGSHLSWVRNNYPVMTEENDGRGIDIDLSWMFLRSREERDAFKAQAKGMPVHMMKKRYG
jgi:hypothetical protein